MMKEKTFDQMINGKAYIENKIFEDDEDVKVVDFADVLKLMQQVRQATISEVVNYCVSQDWVKTIDNLKRMPTDRIIDFEKPTDRITITDND